MSQWEGDGNVADKCPVLRWVVLGVDETNLVLCSQERTERERYVEVVYCHLFQGKQIILEELMHEAQRKKHVKNVEWCW